ncbi:hypothetical protein Taro_011749 [Colocasia esculenta]|uniref:Uncharacterized protein n=1 Tax=Colocasia esculenta TaxID=4460 RepID=A0A843UH12_COLES|nr:hypothetical protein [Colocasia esculenta]
MQVHTLELGPETFLASRSLVPQSLLLLELALLSMQTAYVAVVEVLWDPGVLEPTARPSAHVSAHPPGPEHYAYHSWPFPVKQISQFTHFCLGSVDTRSKQVDTSPRFQKTQLPDWDSRFQKGRSTLDQGRSTLDPVSSKTVLQKWDSRSTLDLGRSTHSGNSMT